MTPYELFDRFLGRIIPSFSPYDFKAKQIALRNNIVYMLNRTQKIFEWQNLPDTIPSRILEMYLQINGNACFAKHNNDLYVFCGGRGGEPDVYYQPTIYTIANPALKYDANLIIGKECVVMPNDSYYYGIIPLLSKYSTLMVETELSFEIAIIMARVSALISSDDDRTTTSAQAYINDIIKGKLGIVDDSQFFDGLRVQPTSTSSANTLTDLIEMEQYLKASMYNEIGLNANYNMKRESINSGESQLNNDALYPLIDDMLYNRQTYADKVNDMFGTTISVSLSSSWRDNEIEIDREQTEISARTENERGVDNENPDTDNT